MPRNSKPDPPALPVIGLPSLGAAPWRTQDRPQSFWRPAPYRSGATRPHCSGWRSAGRVPAGRPELSGAWPGALSAASRLVHTAPPVGAPGAQVDVRPGASATAVGGEYDRALVVRVVET